MAFTFRKISRKIGKTVTEQINRWDWIVLPDKFTAKYLRRYRFEISTFIDVGVGKGTSSLYELFHNRQIVMIDPFPGIAGRCASFLSNPRFNIQLLNFAAGERSMEMDLNLSKGASSLLIENFCQQ